jgi:hypothetical protein
MKMYLKPNIDTRRCNAYSGTAHLYAAISVTGKPIFATNIDNAIDWEVPDDEKGGIIVFSQEVNAVQLSQNKLVNWVKQKLSTFKNKTAGKATIDKIAQKHDLVGWTIGNFLKGRYTGKNGKVYSEDSLSVEIIGVPDDTLIQIGEELCRAFDQETVLIKFYSEKNRIAFVNGD